MIITISQAGANDYHIDVFATATRGGFNDNMDYIRKDESKSISDTEPETIITTLNDGFIIGKTEFNGKYFETKKDEYDFYKYGIISKQRNSTKLDFPKKLVYSGPGGNYLSNEIFYRVARLREGNRPELQTGHFHISKLQTSQGQDFSNKKMKLSLDDIILSITKGIKGLSNE